MNWFYNCDLGPSTLAEFPKAPSAIYDADITLNFCATQPTGYFSHRYGARNVFDFLMAEDVAGYGRDKAMNLAVLDKARASGFSAEIHTFA